MQVLVFAGEERDAVDDVELHRGEREVGELDALRDDRRLVGVGAAPSLSTVSVQSWKPSQARTAAFWCELIASTSQYAPAAPTAARAEDAFARGHEVVDAFREAKTERVPVLRQTAAELVEFALEAGRRPWGSCRFVVHEGGIRST
jgi:hypothetical protein